MGFGLEAPNYPADCGKVMKSSRLRNVLFQLLKAANEVPNLCCEETPVTGQLLRSLW